MSAGRWWYDQTMTSPVVPFTIVYEDRGRFLYASVTGSQDSLEVSRAFWTAIGEECRRRGFDRVLVIESFEQKGPLADVYEVASELPQIMRGIRIAFIDRELGDLEQNMFAETVALNRGATGKLFMDEARAVAWLESAD